MTGADKLACTTATLLLLLTLSCAPAKAQFAGVGGGDGGAMMTQMAPMLEMMKAKMGKRRFGMIIQTVGPMASRMMQNGGGGFGGVLGGGSFGGGATYADNTGGGFTSMLSGAGGSEMMSMIPQLVQIANVGGSHRRHRRR